VSKPVTQFDFSESSPVHSLKGDFITTRGEATDSGAFENNTPGIKRIEIILKTLNPKPPRIFGM
jgi:hypothetical protein